MRKIGILTSGGDAPGMNAAIRAVTRAALALGWQVFGVRQGYAGLIANHMSELDARAVGGIVQHGGTVLGSARSPEFYTPAGRAQALRHLAERGIDGLVVVGGNGSQTGAHALSQAGLAVVGVASTIDNDLVGTDTTIGVDTAVNVTLEAIDRLRTTGSSHQRAFLVETMGRHCGHIALMAGMAGGAEVIAIPEFDIAPHEVAERLRAAYQRGKTHAMVVVAEGAKYNAQAIAQHCAEHRDTIGFELRLTKLGHMVRGGSRSTRTRSQQHIGGYPRLGHCYHAAGRRGWPDQAGGFEAAGIGAGVSAVSRPQTAYFSKSANPADRTALPTKFCTARE